MRAFSSGLAPLLARSCPRFRPNLPLPLLCSSPRQLSRDITSLSKKLIFLLHRLSTTPRASAVTTAEEHYSEASAKEAEVRGLFGEVGRLLRDGGEGPSETGPAPPAEGVQSGGDTSTAVTSDTDTGAVDVAAVTLDEPKQAAGNYWRYARQVSVLGSLLHFPPSPAQTLNPSLSRFAGLVASRSTSKPCHSSTTYFTRRLRHSVTARRSSRSPRSRRGWRIPSAASR